MLWLLFSIKQPRAALLPGLPASPPKQLVELSIPHAYQRDVGCENERVAT